MVLLHFIEETISECIYFMMRHILQMLHQSTSSSEYLLFSFSSGVFIYQLHRYSTDQLHQYSSTLSLPIIFDFFLMMTVGPKCVLGHYFTVGSEGFIV